MPMKDYMSNLLRVNNMVFRIRKLKEVEGLLRACLGSGGGREERKGGCEREQLPGVKV